MAPYYAKVKKSLIDRLTSVFSAITYIVKLKLQLWHTKNTGL